MLDDNPVQVQTFLFLPLENMPFPKIRGEEAVGLLSMYIDLHICSCKSGEEL